MTPLDRLLSCLDEEEQTGRQLCDLTRRKQQVLVAGRPADLLPLVEAEQVLLAGLSRSEVRRLEAARDACRAAGVEEEATIESLAAALDPGPARELRARGKRIAATLSAIHDLNAQNGILIRQSLAWVNFSLNALRRAAGSAGTYDGRDRVAAGNPVPLVVSREA